MSLPAWSWVLHAWVAWRLVPALGPAWAMAIAAVALAASAWLLPQALGGRSRRAASAALRRAAMLGVGWFSSLFVYTLLRDVALLASALLAQHAGVGWPASTLAGPSAWLVLVASLLATAWGYRNARRTAPLLRVDVPIAGLPPAWQGYTIAQISDLHVGPTIGRDDVAAVVDRINAARPDAVAITGDLVDAPAAAAAAEIEPLGALRSTDGTYFVTGNHEYYQGGAPGARAWLRALEGLGVRPLQNAHVTLERGASRLVLAGVTDYGAGHFDPAEASDPARALAGAPADAALRILLAHQPRSAAAAERAGFDLQLSGHTHGGQFWPWNHFVRLQQPFTSGLHRLGRLRVYVSRGTGYWGPPKRFGAPSEITLLRLVAPEG